MDSDTASEEDQTHSNESRHSVLTEKEVEDLSDPSSEEDLTFKNLNTTTASNKPKIRTETSKQVILDEDKVIDLTQSRSSTPTPPPSPPLTLARPISPPRSQSKTPSKQPPKVFHVSGRPRYDVDDGPVTLIPFENSHAKGGFAVRVVRQGKIVGLISAGEEVLCRKLRMEGWSSNLKYLGGGRSNVIMEKQQ